MKSKSWFSRKRAMLQTLIGVRDSGFFVQYEHAASSGREVPAYHAVEEMFGKSRHVFGEHLSAFSQFGGELRKEIDAGRIPWEDAGMFPTLDVFATYGMIRTLRPKRVLEIGSGASTHVITRALSANGSGRLTCIDPQPRRAIEQTGADFERRLLTESDVDIVAEFEAGDTLFVDSSHIMLPGMDVDIEFNRLFPALRSGAIVQIHDIFLPDNYPPKWFDRHYSEQNALIGWLLGEFFDVLYPGYYAATRMGAEVREAVGDIAPADLADNAGSIWLRRR